MINACYRWLSTDPALGDYFPVAPVNDEARKRNSNLPGMGGLFNTVNSNLYHYAGNNPIKYTDPTGRFEVDETEKTITAELGNQKDIKDAAKFFKKNQDYTCKVLDKNGDGISFNNYKDLKTYSKMTSSKANIEDILSMLGNSTFIVSEMGKTSGELSNIFKAIGNVSTGLSALTSVIDIYQLCKDPSISNSLDVIIDAIGFIPGAGPYISIGLVTAKSGVINGAKLMYYSNKYIEEYFNNEFKKVYGFGFK